MMLWPAVALLGFLVLTTLVIALGVRSTTRYEQEKRGTSSGMPAAEPVGALPA